MSLQENVESSNSTKAVARVLDENEALQQAPISATPHSDQEPSSGAQTGSSDFSEPKRGFRACGFEYFYGVFWAYVTYCCATHALESLRIAFLGLPNSGEALGKLVAQLVLWPIFTIVFAWATYRLVLHKASLRMVYVLISIHGLNVFAKGIPPVDLIYWAILSGIVIMGFKKEESAWAPARVQT